MGPPSSSSAIFTSTTTLLQSTMSTSSPHLLHHPNPNYLESKSTIFIIGYFHLHDHPSTIYNVYIISTSPSSSKSNLPIRTHYLEKYIRAFIQEIPIFLYKEYALIHPPPH